MDFLDEKESLRGLDEDLRKSFDDYLSMIAVGSIVTGDPYLEGRSDKDIVLIFGGDLVGKLEDIRKIIQKYDFDESFHFSPIPESSFGVPDSKYSFSNVFRSETLFGKDLVKLAKLPKIEEIKKTYLKGLNGVSNKIYNQIVNSDLWSLDEMRNNFWKLFKHAFMYLSMREHYRTGNYPKTRKEVVDALQSKEVERTFEVLHSIDDKTKEELVDCGNNLMIYLLSLD